MNHPAHRATLVLVLGAALALTLFASCSSEVVAVRKMPIGRPALGGLKDGTYRGSYAYGSYEYVVAVTLVGGRMTAIQVVDNRDTPHAKDAEGVIPRILAAQSPDVDAVSGSTTTSKALMKAVENALAAAPRSN